MSKLFLYFLLLLVSMPFYVSALPNGADTCNVEGMAKGAHGPDSSLQSPGGYSLSTSMTSTGKFEMTINGPGSIEGLLVYVLDGGNKRVGEFVNLPPNLRFKDDCNAKSGTVTHSNPSDKTLPLKLSWNAPQGASGNLIVKSLVVKSFKEWAILNDSKFDATTGATVDSPADNSNNNNNAPAAEGNSFLQKYTLFLIMLGITTLLYIVGSATEAMLKRQQVKSRSFAKTIQNGFGDSR